MHKHILLPNSQLVSLNREWGSAPASGAHGLETRKPRWQTANWAREMCTQPEQGERARILGRDSSQLLRRGEIWRKSWRMSKLSTDRHWGKAFLLETSASKGSKVSPVCRKLGCGEEHLGNSIGKVGLRGSSFNPWAKEVSPPAPSVLLPAAV